MNLRRIRARLLQAVGSAREAAPREPAPGANPPRVRTGIRAGDVYMQYPKGSNNGPNSSP